MTKAEQYATAYAKMLYPSGGTAYEALKEGIIEGVRWQKEQQSVANSKTTGKPIVTKRLHTKTLAKWTVILGIISFLGWCSVGSFLSKIHGANSNPPSWWLWWIGVSLILSIGALVSYEWEGIKKVRKHYRLRREANAWWGNLSFDDRERLSSRYFDTWNAGTLTKDQILIIYGSVTGIE